MLDNRPGFAYVFGYAWAAWVEARTGVPDIDGVADGDGMSALTPLDILLSMMRRRWAARQFDEAVALARIAAPYLHGKAPSARPEGDLAGVPDDKLEDWGRGGGAAAEGADPEAAG